MTNVSQEHHEDNETAHMAVYACGTPSENVKSNARLFKRPAMSFQRPKNAPGSAVVGRHVTGCEGVKCQCLERRCRCLSVSVVGACRKCPSAAASPKSLFARYEGANMLLRI